MSIRQVTQLMSYQLPTVAVSGRCRNNQMSIAMKYICCSPGVSMLQAYRGMSWRQTITMSPRSSNASPLVFSRDPSPAVCELAHCLRTDSATSDLYERGGLLPASSSDPSTDLTNVVGMMMRLSILILGQSPAFLL